MQKHLENVGQTPNPQQPAGVFRLPRRSLRTTLLLWFLGISLLPLGLVTFFADRVVSQNRLEAVGDQLTMVSRIHCKAVQKFFYERVQEMESQARCPLNLGLLLGMCLENSTCRMETQDWVRSEGFRTQARELGQPLIEFFNTSVYDDILLTDQRGNVVFSCQEREDLGSNLLFGFFGGSGLGEACRNVLQTGEPAFSKFQSYPPARGRPVSFLIQALRGNQGQTAGLMIFLLDADQLAGLVADQVREGRFVQTYLVNSRLELLTPYHQQPYLEIGKDKIITDQTLAWAQARQSDEGRLLDLTEGNEQRDPTILVHKGPQGRMVLGTLLQVTVLGHHLAVVSEVDRSAALAGTRLMRFVILGLILAVMLVVTLAGLLVTRRIVNPIEQLGHNMQRVADGHQVKETRVTEHNEVGDLEDQFAAMLEKLDEARQLNERQYALKQSQFELNERMRGKSDLVSVATAILEYLGEYYQAQVGLFYLAGSGRRLKLAARFGLLEGQEPDQKLNFGEGVIGRAAEKQEMQVLHHLSADHMLIRTGTGASVPRCVIVAPIQVAGRVKGVLELGTVEDVTEGELEFLKLCNGSISAALDSVGSRERVQRLLEETRRQASVLSRNQLEMSETNERLARSDKYKNEFLANMSHELRTPLNSMLIMSQIMAENKSGNLTDDQIEAAETIHNAGSELLTLINDILDLSKVEAGKMEISEEAANLHDVVAALDDLFRPVAESRVLDFRVLLESGLPETVKTDSLRLKQILRNLLDNAFKFTKTGSVVLRLRLPGPEENQFPGDDVDVGQWLAFSVADTGVGMSHDVLTQVFEAFKQGDGSVAREFGGSGLGLSISNKLAKLLGGKLVAESIPGKGSNFTLYLPLAHPNKHLPSVESSAPAALGRSQLPQLDILAGKTVLLADCDMRTVFNLTEEFDDLQVNVVIARNWDECQKLACRHPDTALVLINPDLPGVPGRNFAQLLRQALANPNLPLLGLADREREDPIPEVDSVIKKPMPAREIVAIAAAVLEENSTCRSHC